jgi:parvulin-like peptidyl-prolyl isomerase
VKPQPARTRRKQSPRNAPRVTLKPPGRRDTRSLIFGFGAHLSLRERERLRHTIVVTAAIVVVSIAVLVLGAGYYIQYLRKPSLPVATVNGHVIRRDFWQREARLGSLDIQVQTRLLQTKAAADPAHAAAYLTEQQQLQAKLNDPPEQYIPTMVDDYLVQQDIPQLQKQGAPAASVSVTSSEVDDALNQWKQALQVTDQSQYQQALKSLDVSEKELRTHLETYALRQKVKSYVAGNVASTQPEVKMGQIVTTDKAKADEALGKLQSGDDFASTVTLYSTDAASKAKGGDLGWVAKGVQSTALDTFAFAEPPPKIFSISPVLVDGGSFKIFRVLDRATGRPLDEGEINQIKETRFAAWLKELEGSAAIQRFPQNQQ